MHGLKSSAGSDLISNRQCQRNGFVHVKCHRVEQSDRSVINVNEQRELRASQDHSSIAPGPIFSAQQKYKNFIRLSCGQAWSQKIDHAVRTFGDLCGKSISR